MKRLQSSLPFFIALILFVYAANIMAAAWADVDEQPELKQDMPKLDTPIQPIKPPPLKGSVERSEQLPGQTSTPLNGGAGASANQNGGLSGRAAAGSGGLVKRKGKPARVDALSAGAESGIGIIGVKFVMVYGRLPVINRVFPGTPAAENGLRPSDVIVAVDGIPTYGLAKEEVYNMIVGTPHTSVTLSTRRRNDFQVRTMQRMDFNDITDPRVRRDYQSMETW